MLIPMLADAKQMPAVSTGSMSGYKAEPGRKVATVLELFCISDRGNQRGCRLRTNPFDLRNSLTDFTLLKDLIDSAIEVCNAEVDFPQELIKVSDCLSEQRGKAVVRIL